MSALPLDWRPRHAYRPGQNERHADDLFDSIKQRAEGVDLATIPDTDAWHFGLAFLQDGYFWEAHEVLEPLWLASPPNGAERLFLQGIIQLANASLKQAMGKARASERLFAQSEDLVREAFQRSPGRILGVSKEEFSDLRASCTHISSEK